MNVKILKIQRFILISFVVVSSLSSLGTPPSSMLLSPGSNQPIHTLMPSPQSFPPNPVLSPQQNIPRPVSNKNLAFRRIVPTDQETCPNRIVGSRVMASPKTPIRSPAVTQYGTDFGVTESWAGDEPLVDLGAIPPPSGINPRMTIPTQHHMSESYKDDLKPVFLFVWSFMVYLEWFLFARYNWFQQLLLAL